MIKVVPQIPGTPDFFAIFPHISACQDHSPPGGMVK